MKRLYRSEMDTKLAGVCGGLAEEFGIDANIVRLATVFACAVSGVAPLVITYIVAWIILPKGKPQEE
jgi:phage shock protein C